MESVELTSSWKRVFLTLSYFLKPLRSSVRRRRDISSPRFCTRILMSIWIPTIPPSASNLVNYLVEAKKALWADAHVAHRCHLCHDPHAPTMLRREGKKIHVSVPGRHKIWEKSEECTLFMMAMIPGSQASMCILLNASEGGGLSCQKIPDLVENGGFKRGIIVIWWVLIKTFLAPAF